MHARVCVTVCVCEGERERVYVKRLMLYTVEAKPQNYTARGTDGTHTPLPCRLQLDTRQVLDKPPFTVRDIVAKRRSYLGSTSC